jgi:hypothetical protein
VSHTALWLAPVDELDSSHQETGTPRYAYASVSEAGAVVNDHQLSDYLKY